jgi:hypothetical protein
MASVFESVVKSIEDWFWSKPKVTPIEINIVSTESVSGSKIRTRFDAKFHLVTVGSRKMYFNTTGTFYFDEILDEKKLIQILSTTHYDKYIKANMTRKELGSFNYEYEYNNKWLIVEFTTF